MGSMAFLPLSQVLVGGEGCGSGIALTVLAGAELLALLNRPPPPPKGTLGHSGWSQSCSVAGDPACLCSSVRKGRTQSPRSLHNLIILQPQKASVEEDLKAQLYEDSSHMDEAGG